MLLWDRSHVGSLFLVPFPSLCHAGLLHGGFRAILRGSEGRALQTSHKLQPPWWNSSIPQGSAAWGMSRGTWSLMEMTR